MIRRITEHNQLNGVAFSTLEFIVVAAAAGLIGVGMAAQHRLLGAVLATGTVLNCLMIVAYGVAAWRRGERGTSLRRVFSAKHRAELAREHPNLMTDTLIVAVAALIPYVLLVAVAGELVRTRRG